MKIYCYNAKTKEFLRDREAQKDPLESRKRKKSVFMFPSNATSIKPPAIKENEVACFINNAWQILPDFRGDIYYYKETKEKIIFIQIGEKPDNKLTLEIPENDQQSWDEFSNSWVNDPEKEKEVKNDKILKEINSLDLSSIIIVIVNILNLKEQLPVESQEILEEREILISKLK